MRDHGTPRAHYLECTTVLLVDQVFSSLPTLLLGTVAVALEYAMIRLLLLLKKRRGDITGCGVTANMPVLGTGDSGFESRHPDRDNTRRV